MSIKKNFFAPLALGLGATRRAAMLLLVMMLTTATAWAQGQVAIGSCGDNLTWELTQHEYDDFYTLTISGMGAMYDYVDPSECPWNSYAEQIQEVVIGNGVTSIGEYAFSDCYNLESVTVFAPSCSLGDDAFYDCNNLANIYVFSDFVDDYQEAENWSDYAEIIKEMTNLNSKCGDDLTWELTQHQHEYDIFYTLTISGTGAMYDYDLEMHRTPWNSYAEQIYEVVIENGVTSIGEYAFDGCTGLTSITIPASVTSIGNYAFSGCTGLTSIEIPSSVTSIGEDVFLCCEELESVTFAEGSQLKSIGNWAFQQCSNLTSITIPASVTSIGEDVFLNCFNLASMAVADGNTVYDSRNGCNAIIEKSTNKLIIGCKNSTIPASVTSIGNYAFYTTRLTSIEIPASVTSIGMRAFQNCPNLATVTVYAPSCTLGANAFLNCNKLENIYVFSDLVDDYQGAWSTYAEKITEMPNPNGKCGDNVRWVLTGEPLDYTLTISGEGAMYYGNPSEYPWYSYAGKINEVVIGNGVTSISNNAFQGCSNLATVSFAPYSTLKTIGDGAFQGCSNLTSITIPASVTSIGSDVFANCSNLEAITVDGGNTVYDSRNGCNAIIVKSTNTLIFGCKNSTIPAGVTSIGESAFYATDLTSIEIPAGVTSIGAWAFCVTGLTSIEIPASVTSIGMRAFQNCPNLATVTVYAPSCSLGDKAFLNCSNLENIYVFSDLVDGYKDAENWSSYEDKITALPTVTTSYVDATGTLHEGVEAIPLNNVMTTLPAGWYVVNSDISYTGTITLNGDVNIILADGKTMSVVPTTAGFGINGYNSSAIESYNLTIYGQTGQSGTLAATTSGVAGPKGWDGTPGYAIYVGGYTQHGGIVTLNTSGGIATCISAEADVTITRGTLTANTTATYSCGISAMGKLTISGGSITANATGGDETSLGIRVLTHNIWDGYNIIIVPSTLTFSSGNVEANSIYMDDDDGGGTINLSWTNATDRFKVTEYVNGTITIADGKAFHNGSEPLSGTVTDKTKLNGKTLTPPTYSVTANRATTQDTEYWSTFYHPAAGYTADENTTVYQAAVNTMTNKVELTAVPGREIPADKAVVLKSTQSAITLSRATTTQTLDGNELKGGSTVADGTVPYTLAAKDGTVGFYKFVGAALNPNKAHLEITAPAQSAPAFLGFEENTTAINEHELHESHELSGAWYTLDGRKLQGKPSAKGIYVRNGRKFIIK